MASDLPVDLLEEIFLHLDDAADLARASAACVPFRRVVSDGRFLRRFRSLHRRPVLGLLYTGRDGGIAFYPAEPPHSSAPAAAALAADYFAFPSLPDPSSWRVLDVRDRRVLLAPRAANPCTIWKDLVVYDPLHRRHVKIPAIPGDLLEASRDEYYFAGMWQTIEPFLAPAAAADEDDELSLFRVMCNVTSYTNVATFVFSSVSGQWQLGATCSSNPTKCFWRNFPSLWVRQYYANSCCFYWTSYHHKVMLVLDTTSEMKFSFVDLPPKSRHQSKVVAEAAGEGRLGLLVLGDYEFNLYSRAWPGNNGVIVTEEWRHDDTIPVSENYRWWFAGGAEGYVILQGLPRDQIDPWARKKLEAHYFTVDSKTLKVERLMCVSEFDDCPKFLYASFPPPFSPPSIV